jgi:diaminohydroxyphosphoribosylaminopyrimidine deaminase/5-amino-6-(5-phosphoribosylamino)uracil reductase
MTSRFDTEPPIDSVTDGVFMAAAVAMARQGLGVTAPNPSVGCVIVRDGLIVGRGFTQPGGRPHAETEAIRDAGPLAQGATLYVTLEPCSHYGVTSPCADAIVQAGLARVVSALEDPDVRVAGRGHAKIVEAGIGLRTGVGVVAARRANLGHILRVTEGRPMVTLKLAETADGYAAGDDHDPRLAITGPAANGRVQIMRAMHDAIMVGIGTARADDPLLTVRLPGLEHRRPLRVVLDPRLRLPLRSRLVTTAGDWPTLVLAGPQASIDAERALTAQGVTVERVAADAEGRLNLQEALHLLARRGITRVFSEGGPRIAAALIAQNLADEVVIFTSPKPFGRVGVPALDGASRQRLGDATLFQIQAEGLSGLDHYRHLERVR